MGIMKVSQKTETSVKYVSNYLIYQEYILHWSLRAIDFRSDYFLYKTRVMTLCPPFLASKWSVSGHSVRRFIQLHQYSETFISQNFKFLWEHGINYSCAFTTSYHVSHYTVYTEITKITSSIDPKTEPHEGRSMVSVDLSGQAQTGCVVTKGTRLCLESVGLSVLFKMNAVQFTLD